MNMFANFKWLHGLLFKHNKTRAVSFVSNYQHLGDHLNCSKYQQINSQRNQVINQTKYDATPVLKVIELI